MIRNTLRFSSSFIQSQRNFSASSSDTPVVRQGAGFFQRFSSFVVGAGLSALVSQYFIYKELVDGNSVILKKQRDMEKRLDSLEK
mmetsp:Transcript_8527/g.10781  ORF Transcript_8527/g.10781 Transcript_8527/m.10781 type:complete len:85 (-) Transcript_8527:191-445(-)